MGSEGTDNQGRFAITPAIGINRRYFGLIYASIDHQNKSIDLRFRPSANDRYSLGDGHRKWCLDWALSVLADYRQRGYEIITPAG